MHWKKTFVIPTEANLSAPAVDILKRLITDSDERLGKNGADEIKAHPFFQGTDWEGLCKQSAPYIPNVTSEISNENFDHFDEEEPFHPDAENRGKKPPRKLDLNFIGYTYKADVEEQRS